jgi:hypothetical protein
MMFHAAASPANRYVYVSTFTQKNCPDTSRTGSAATTRPAA